MRGRQLYRGTRPAARVAGRSVIVTDDGIVTSSTLVAALLALHLGRPYEVIVAVPMASPEQLAEVRRHCDEVVCLHTPRLVRAVTQFYDDFAPVEDEQVIALLPAYARQEEPGMVAATRT